MTMSESTPGEGSGRRTWSVNDSDDLYSYCCYLLGFFLYLLLGISFFGLWAPAWAFVPGPN